MGKKFKSVAYPQHMLEDKLRNIIVGFLDKHEATICHEDMSSEIMKHQMALALADDLIKGGVVITYMKIAKKEDESDNTG